MADLKDLQKAIRLIEMKIDDIQEELKSSTDRKVKMQLQKDLKKSTEDPEYQKMLKQVVELEAAAAKEAAKAAVGKPQGDATKVVTKRMSINAGPVTDATPESVMALVAATLAAGDKDPAVGKSLQSSSLGLGLEKVLALDFAAVDAALAGKDVNARLGALRCVKALAWASPVSLPRMEAVAALSGNAKEGKTAIDAMITVLKDCDRPEALPMVLPSVQAMVGDKKWKVKVAGLEVFAATVERMSEAGLMRQLAAALATEIPRVVEASREIRQELRDGARAVLNAVGACIANPEIKKLNESVIAALADPTNQKLTQEVLMDLGSTTFMNYVDANALALLVPILARALRDKEQKSKKWGAQILGSCVKLVADIDFLVPYLPLLLPLLKAALIDPTPEVQREAAKAFGQMALALPEVDKNDISPFLEGLTASTEINERTGCAHAMSYITFVAGKDALPKLLNRAFAGASSENPHVRHSYCEVLDSVPAIFKEDFAPFIPQAISKVLECCGDKDEDTNAAANRAAASLISFFAPLCPDALLPALRDAYFRATDGGVRNQIVKHIALLASKLMEHKKYGQDVLSLDLGPVATRRELAILLYIMWKGDSDSSCVRSAANPWKDVGGAPKMLKELLAELLALTTALKATCPAFEKAYAKVEDSLVTGKVCTAEDLAAPREENAYKLLREMNYTVRDAKSGLEDSSNAPSEAAATHDLAATIAQVKQACAGPFAATTAALRAYVETVAVSVIVEGQRKKDVRAKLEKVIKPFVPEITSEALDEMTEAFAGTSGGDDGDDGEELLRVDNMMLMYGGGKLLLENTTLRMCRGRRYGVVGHNGAGKTTLMKQLIAGNVANMPKDIKVVHVSDAELGDLKVLEMNALEFVGRDAPEGVDINAALEDVNYPRDMQDKLVSDLSGGWRMRLILARAMMKNADVLLLDEPTNHLDVQAVAWLEEYLQKCTTGTMMIISHEAAFINAVCTDVMQYKDRQLHYYRGNFDEFQRQIGLTDADREAYLKGDVNLDTPEEGDEEKVQVTAVASKQKLTFPIPGKLSGIASSSKAVMSMKGVNFAYDMSKGMNLKDINVKLTLGSRVAIVGRNGAGKSTLMGLLCRELNPSEVEGQVGEVYRHHNLRLAYIAQHHMETLGTFYRSTPYQYMQYRFQNGWDELLQKHLLDPKDDEEQLHWKELAKTHGKYGLMVGAVIGRTQKGKQLLYEVQWDGLMDQKQNTWEPLEKFRAMGIERWAIACDERIQAQTSGNDQRAVSRREVVKHLEQFGIDEEMCCNREIGSFSAGQKSKMALGAVFWTRPHLVALDEPTNYLDPETVSALARALKWFRGGVVVITHHQGFIDEVCNTEWRVADGECTIHELENDNKRFA